MSVTTFVNGFPFFLLSVYEIQWLDLKPPASSAQCQCLCQFETFFSHGLVANSCSRFGLLPKRPRRICPTGKGKDSIISAPCIKSLWTEALILYQSYKLTHKLCCLKTIFFKFWYIDVVTTWNHTQNVWESLNDSFIYSSDFRRLDRVIKKFPGSVAIIGVSSALFGLIYDQTHLFVKRRCNFFFSFLHIFLGIFTSRLPLFFVHFVRNVQ